MGSMSSLPSLHWQLAIVLNNQSFDAYDLIHDWMIVTFPFICMLMALTEIVIGKKVHVNLDLDIFLGILGQVR